LGKDLWDKNFLFQSEKFEKQINSCDYFQDDKADPEFIEQLHFLQNPVPNNNKKHADSFSNSLKSVKLQVPNIQDNSVSESEKLLKINRNSRSLTRNTKVAIRKSFFIC
jgi:hypothetical protein